MIVAESGYITAAAPIFKLSGNVFLEEFKPGDLQVAFFISNFQPSCGRAFFISKSHFGATSKLPGSLEAPASGT